MLTDLTNISTWIVLLISLRFTMSVGEVISSISDDKALELFNDFINKYDKPYKSDKVELNHRLSIFKESLMRHQQLNAKSNSSTNVYGITKFSDLTPEEFKARFLSDIKTPHVSQNKKTNVFDMEESVKSPKPLPDKVDWRTKGIISPVKNQLQCGACWAFSTVETVESMYALKTNSSPPELSVQEVIDCAAGNFGCDGGDTCSALEWMVTSKTPLVEDSVYPLTDKSQFCQILSNGTKGVTVKSRTCLQKLVTDEKKMLELLATVGPLTVSVDATTWNDYLGGIIQYHCRGLSNNHAVQIVGYDLTGEIPYYIVRNSWGSDFGHAGYLYIKYGNNVCGISREVSTVVV